MTWTRHGQIGGIGDHVSKWEYYVPKILGGRRGNYPQDSRGGRYSTPWTPSYMYTRLWKKCVVFSLNILRYFNQTQFLQKNTKTKKNLCLSLKFASGARIQGSGGMSTIAPPDRFRIASHSTYKKENLVQNMKVKKNVHIILLEDS